MMISFSFAMLCSVSAVFALAPRRETIIVARQPMREEREKSMDILKDMFEKQAELNRRIGVDTTQMPEAEQPKWILNYCRAMSQEVSELTDSVPWKWWAKYQEYNKQNARVEIVDLFHFLISLAQVAGLSAEDVHRLYLEKNKVNFQRQDSGYKVKQQGDDKHIGV